MTLDRDNQLRTQHYIAPQDYDNQVAAVGTSEAAVRADQTQIESARLMLDYAQVKSPIDGVTGVRLVDPGNVVHASDPNGLVVVAQLDPIAVFFTLPQDDLQQVAAAMAHGSPEVQVYGRDGTTLLGTGQLADDRQSDRSDHGDDATQRPCCRILQQHPVAQMLFVHVRLLVATRESAIVVPSVAVQRGPDGMFVYVVGADQRVSVRPIDIDLNQDDVTLISRGLGAGETVVTEGQNRLRPGARVAVRSQGAAPTHARVRLMAAMGAAREHFGPVHTAPRGDVARHGGIAVGGNGGVQPAACRAASAGRLSDYCSVDGAARRERRDDGVGGDDAARTTIWPDARSEPDDVD